MVSELYGRVHYQFVCSTKDSLLCYWTKWIYRILWIFLVIGTTGNCLTLLVLSQKKMRRISTSVYWAFLACSDLGTLWSLSLYFLTLAEWGENLQDKGPIPCVLWQWLLYTTGGFSVWLLVFLTAERFLCTMFPHSVRCKLSTRNAVITSLVTFGIICLLNGHLLFGFSWDARHHSCMFSSDTYRRFFSSEYNYMVFVVYCIVPIVLVSVGNVTIACKIRRRTRRVQPAAVQSLSVTRNNSTTRMLLVVSGVFVLSLLPYCVFKVAVAIIERQSLERNKLVIQFIGAVVDILLMGNFTFNFVLYCTSGSLFKEQWWAMVRRWRDKCSARTGLGQEEITIYTHPS